MTTKVQSVLFDKNKWSRQKASSWIKKNDFKIMKVDITDKFYRYRQFHPKTKDKFRTKIVGKGIKFIIKI